MTLSGRTQHRPRAGDWFTVPLPDGSNAVGHAAQVAGRGTVLLTYFFSPPTQQATLQDCLHQLPRDAIAAVVCSGIALRDGDWPLIGHADVNPRAWPVPEFERTKPTGHGEVLLAVVRGRNLLSKDASWQLSMGERGLRQPDGMFGYQAAATYVHHRLTTDAKRVGEQPWWRRAASPRHWIESDQQPKGAVEEQAVTVRIPGPPQRMAELESFTDHLIEDLNRSGVGEFDGTLRSENGFELYLYGDDAELLAQLTIDVARQQHLPEGTHLDVRPGPPGTAARTQPLR